MSALACKWARISPSDFYEIKEAFEKYGPEGLAPSGAWQAPDAESDTTRFRREASRDDGTLPHLQQLRMSQQLRLVGLTSHPSAFKAQNRATLFD